MHPKSFWPRMRQLTGGLAWLAAAALPVAPAAAQEFTVSGFGTAGYAISNRPYNYQRSVNETGTFDRDSVFGLQGDLRLNPQWSATVQMKAAQSIAKDGRWDLIPAWAFVAWRPADDWLLRAGKLRLPLYLHSEALDVGVAYDVARLPDEMYSIAPTNDFNGLTVNKSWFVGDNDLSLDTFAGGVTLKARYWTRDGWPPVVEAGAQFVEVRTRVQGAVLSFRNATGIWRAGVHRAQVNQTNGNEIPVRFPFVNLGNGLGYYKVDGAMPGPPIESTRSITNYVITLGVEQEFAPGWRVAAEFARDIQRKTEVASDTTGGYVALFHSIGRATPYLSYGVLRSGGSQTDWYRRLTENPLPSYLPGATQINAAQRLQAESIWALDQRTVAIGSSYGIDDHQKLKLEWARTHVGRVSRLVDAMPGRPVPHDTHIDVFSASYNFSF